MSLPELPNIQEDEEVKTKILQAVNSTEEAISFKDMCEQVSGKNYKQVPKSLKTRVRRIMLSLIEEGEVDKESSEEMSQDLPSSTISLPNLPNEPGIKTDAFLPAEICPSHLPTAGKSEEEEFQDSLVNIPWRNLPETMQVCYQRVLPSESVQSEKNEIITDFLGASKTTTSLKAERELHGITAEKKEVILNLENSSEKIEMILNPRYGITGEIPALLSPGKAVQPLQVMNLPEVGNLPKISPVVETGLPVLKEYKAVFGTPNSSFHRNPRPSDSLGMPAKDEEPCFDFQKNKLKDVALLSKFSMVMKHEPSTKQNEPSAEMHSPEAATDDKKSIGLMKEKELSEFPKKLNESTVELHSAEAGDGDEEDSDQELIERLFQELDSTYKQNDAQSSGKKSKKTEKRRQIQEVFQTKRAKIGSSSSKSKVECQQKKDLKKSKKLSDSPKKGGPSKSPAGSKVQKEKTKVVTGRPGTRVKELKGKTGADGGRKSGETKGKKNTLPQKKTTKKRP